MPHSKTMYDKSWREQALADRREWESMGGCSCHISPPCGSCVHPGNPMNCEDFEDEIWKEDEEPTMRAGERLINRTGIGTTVFQLDPLNRRIDTTLLSHPFAFQLSDRQDA